VSYFFSEGARVEHLEHIAYYEEQRIGLGARYLSAFEAAWLTFVKIQIGFALNLLPVSGGVEYRAFRTTFSIASPARRLKCWWSRLIVDGQVIGWAGFNGSFHRTACGAL
jgi:hypothetical protein